MNPFVLYVVAIVGSLFSLRIFLRIVYFFLHPLILATFYYLRILLSFLALLPLQAYFYLYINFNNNFSFFFFIYFQCILSLLRQQESVCAFSPIYYLTHLFLVNLKISFCIINSPSLCFKSLAQQLDILTIGPYKHMT